MLLFKFPFNLLMLDKRKKQDSSHRYATVPKMSTEEQRFKTGTKMKTISICRLSMSSTNTEPVSEKENVVAKNLFRLYVGSLLISLPTKPQRSRMHLQVQEECGMWMLSQVLGQPSVCCSAFPNTSLSALLFATEQ